MPLFCTPYSHKPLHAIPYTLTGEHSPRWSTVSTFTSSEPSVSLTTISTICRGATTSKVTPGWGKPLSTRWWARGRYSRWWLVWGSRGSGVIGSRRGRATRSITRLYDERSSTVAVNIKYLFCLRSTFVTFPF